MNLWCMQPFVCLFVCLFPFWKLGCSSIAMYENFWIVSHSHIYWKQICGRMMIALDVDDRHCQITFWQFCHVTVDETLIALDQITWSNCMIASFEQTIKCFDRIRWFTWTNHLIASFDCHCLTTLIYIYTYIYILQGGQGGPKMHVETTRSNFW